MIPTNRFLACLACALLAAACAAAPVRSTETLVDRDGKTPAEMALGYLGPDDDGLATTLAAVGPYSNALCMLSGDGAGKFPWSGWLLAPQGSDGGRRVWARVFLPDLPRGEPDALAVVDAPGCLPLLVLRVRETDAFFAPRMDLTWSVAVFLWDGERFIALDHLASGLSPRVLRLDPPEGALPEWHLYDPAVHDQWTGWRMHGPDRVRAALTNDAASRVMAAHILRRSVDAATNGYRVVEAKADIQSTEGNQVKGWYDTAGTVRRIEVAVFGETGRRRVLAWLDVEGRIVSARDLVETYDKPFGPVKRTERSDAYFGVFNEQLQLRLELAVDGRQRSHGPGDAYTRKLDAGLRDLLGKAAAAIKAAGK